MILHRILYVVGQVAEEVYSSTLFQFIDSNGVLGTYIVRIPFMLHPEGNCIVASIDFRILLGKGQNRHVEVVRTSQPAAIYHCIVSCRNGTAFDHIERIAESGLVVVLANEVLQLKPNPLTIETAQLRMHVAEVERLTIRLFRVESVGTSKHVASLITATNIVNQTCANSLRKHRIGLERVASSAKIVKGLALSPPVAIPIHIVRRETRIPFVGRPATCLEA